MFSLESAKLDIKSVSFNLFRQQLAATLDIAACLKMCTYALNLYMSVNTIPYDEKHFLNTMWNMEGFNEIPVVLGSVVQLSHTDSSPDFIK